MQKLSSSHELRKDDFSSDEFLFLKLLFNEYVQLAYFLMQSLRIDPGLRLLIIFPRVNFFKILHEEVPQIPPDEPQTLGELAAYHSLIFPLREFPGEQKEKKSYRIPERVLQERRIAAIKALANSTIDYIQAPLVRIEYELMRSEHKDPCDQKIITRIHARLKAISMYLKKLHNLQRIVLDETGRNLALDKCMEDTPAEKKQDALEEIAESIQIAEIEEMRDVITTKMLDYLSAVTLKLEQLEKISSPGIKKEIIQDLHDRTRLILSQSGAFYRLILGTCDT
jgi:hypothetical protein